jgi:hypothetical protein
MGSCRLNSPPRDLCIFLRSVLKDAAQAVPEAERTTSLMACLAEKILTLAANGTTDAADLRRMALSSVREACDSCSGCAGLHGSRRTRVHQPIALDQGGRGRRHAATSIGS